jgi:hypothetical protein
VRFLAFLVALLPLASTVITGCGPGEDARARLPVPVAGATLENDQDELVRLAFPDGSKTENDRCIVSGRPLTPELPPVWVNGKPIGFC